jgi:hypothetical protein
MMSLSPLLRKHRERRNEKRSAVLKRATPYPWRRDAKGNLIGANGHAIYFMGEDAILVEHAPVMREALISVRRQAKQGALVPSDALHAISRLADNLISAIERANCRRTSGNNPRSD